MEPEILWNATKPGRWESLADRVAAPLPQRWTYGIALRATGAAVDRAEIRLGTRTVALAQFVNRRWLGMPYALLSRGPLWLTDLDEAGRAAVLSGLRTGPPGAARRAVLITPDTPALAPILPRAGLNPLMTPATHATIDLTRGPQALRRAMHRKWRNRLCAAENTGIRARIETDLNRLDWLLDRERRQQRRRRYRNFPAAFFRAWARTDPAGADLRCLVVGTQVAGAMLTLVHGNTATYQLGWTAAAGRTIGAHNLLLWSLIRDLHARGIRSLDLGPLDTERTPGLARFKLGAGARPVILGGTHLGWRLRTLPYA